MVEASELATGLLHESWAAELDALLGPVSERDRKACFGDPSCAGWSAS